MFDNAGGKLSTIIRVWTAIEILAAIIMGLILGLSAGSFLMFLLISVVIPIVLWIGSLFLIAILDMTSDVYQIKYSLSQIEHKVNKTSVAVDNSNVSNSADANNTVPNYWTCPKCKTANDKKDVYCSKCGEKKNQW